VWYSNRVDPLTHPLERQRSAVLTGYRLRDAARLLQLNPTQIRAFVREGFLSPQRGPRGELRFSFQDLVLLRTAKELSERLSPRKVRRAMHSLRRQLPKGRQLSAVRLAVEGDTVVVRSDTVLWNADSGQILLDFDLAELAAAVAPLARANAQQARDSELPLRAEEWYELGCDLETCDESEALDAYRRAIEIDPRHMESHVNLGRIFHESGELRAAEFHYRLALSLAPGDATAVFNLGVVLGDQGRNDEAIAAYEKAIALDTENADAHCNLAMLYEIGGERQKAIQHYTLYHRLGGASPEP
jgi:Flp pilus assembly protein TadD